MEIRKLISLYVGIVETLKIGEGRTTKVVVHEQVLQLGELKLSWQNVLNP
jgi:hypothetical protein